MYGQLTHNGHWVKCQRLSDTLLFEGQCKKYLWACLWCHHSRASRHFLEEMYTFFTSEQIFFLKLAS